MDLKWLQALLATPDVVLVCKVDTAVVLTPAELISALNEGVYGKGFSHEGAWFVESASDHLAALERLIAKAIAARADFAKRLGLEG